MSFVRAAVLIGLSVMQTGNLTPDERALTAYVDAHNAESLALLERVVNINSGTQNFAGVREVGDVFAQNSTRSGSDALGGRRGVQARRAPRSRAPGTGPRILLIGHLDTVFEKDSPFQKFERVDDRPRAGPASST